MNHHPTPITSDAVRPEQSAIDGLASRGLSVGRGLHAGRVLDATWRTTVTSDHYLIRIEATPRAAALIFALALEPRWIDPDSAGGPGWYELEYNAQLDCALKQFVDFASDVVYHQPSFGQFTLFDLEEPRG
jgi:hypothetical protein